MTQPSTEQETKALAAVYRLLLQLARERKQGTPTQNDDSISKKEKQAGDESYIVHSDFAASNNS